MATVKTAIFYVRPKEGPYWPQDLVWTNYSSTGNPKKGWQNEEYRTLTFDAPLTGDLLAWFQQYAVKE